MMQHFNKADTPTETKLTLKSQPSGIILSVRAFHKFFLVNQFPSQPGEFYILQKLKREGMRSHLPSKYR